jgi:hypothetical protein
MRVGVTKLTYWDKEGENIEVKGHKPDINCSGQDAFNVALSLDRDEGRQIGFREKNEKISENKIYVEYDPQMNTDTRKAYYAKYVDPAIAKIENANTLDVKPNALRGYVDQKMAYLRSKIAQRDSGSAKAEESKVLPAYKRTTQKFKLPQTTRGF